MRSLTAIVGPPGSGKTEITRQIQSVRKELPKAWSVVVISIEELIRKKVASDHSFCAANSLLVRNKLLLPDSAVNDLFLEALRKNSDLFENIILIGYPLSFRQFTVFERACFEDFGICLLILCGEREAHYARAKKELDLLWKENTLSYDKFTPPHEAMVRTFDTMSSFAPRHGFDFAKIKSDAGTKTISDLTRHISTQLSRSQRRHRVLWDHEPRHRGDRFDLHLQPNLVSQQNFVLPGSAN